MLDWTFRFAVTGMITNTRRDIKTHHDSVPAAGIGEFTHHIPFAIVERRFRDIARGRCTQSETEPIVILAYENQAVKPALFTDFHNFFRNEMFRRKKHRILGAIIPFFIRKGVQAEVDNSVTAVCAVPKHTFRQTASY